MLYLSCHEILEYDELRLFSEDLDIDCYSLGAYTQPGGEHHRKRPSLPDLPYDAHFIELALQYPKENLHPEMLEGIDVVMVMGGITTGCLESNRHLLEPFIARGGRAILRSIGQSVSHIETYLQHARSWGVEIVRYSPFESTIQNYAGQNACIRFYKDAEDFLPWEGTDIRVINFTQGMAQRADHTGYVPWQYASAGLPATVFGPGNEELGRGARQLEAHEQIQVLQGARAYFYAGTYPASYTLSFIEALAAGTPMVAVGAELGNGKMYPGQRTYEVHDLLPSFAVTDDLDLANKMLEHLVLDPEPDKVWSEAMLRVFEMHFARPTIAAQWKAYLNV